MTTLRVMDESRVRPGPTSRQKHHKDDTREEKETVEMRHDSRERQRTSSSSQPDPDRSRRRGI